VFDDELNAETSSYSSNYEYGYGQPIIEDPKRASRVLYNIAKAHAFVIHGRNYITLDDIPILIKIVISTTNRDRVSLLKILLSEMRNADEGGKSEHKKQIFTSEIKKLMNASKSTARRTMKELEILGLVRMGSKNKNGGDNHYIELMPEYGWLLEEQFQGLIKNFDWSQCETEAEGEQEEEQRNPSIYRMWQHSDQWACRRCKLYGDIHLMREHICSGDKE
jgi:hypothetical protein